MPVLLRCACEFRNHSSAYYQYSGNIVLKVPVSSDDQKMIVEISNRVIIQNIILWEIRYRGFKLIIRGPEGPRLFRLFETIYEVNCPPRAKWTGGPGGLVRKSIIVKEQRVDGNWQDCTPLIEGCNSYLRGTRKGFEINYQVSLYSNQFYYDHIYIYVLHSTVSLSLLASSKRNLALSLIHKIYAHSLLLHETFLEHRRYYSTASLQNKLRNSEQQQLLDPWFHFLTGFVDGGGNVRNCLGRG